MFSVSDIGILLMWVFISGDWDSFWFTIGVFLTIASILVVRHDKVNPNGRAAALALLGSALLGSTFLVDWETTNLASRLIGIISVGVPFVLLVLTIALRLRKFTKRP